MAEIVGTEDLRKLAGELFKSVYKVLDNYNKSIDMLIPWKDLEKFVNDIDEYIQQYSKESSKLVGEVKTLVMNAMDQYFASTQTIYEWCALTTTLLELYKRHVAASGGVGTEKETNVVRTVLAEGEKMMKQAQDDLLKCSKAFNDAAGKIATLKVNLHNDFLETSAYFASVINRIRWGGYSATLVTAVVGGVLAVYILGPFGLLVPLGILAVGAAAIEGVAIPLVKEKFAAIEKMYGTYSEQVNGAEISINDTKTKIQDEVHVVAELRAKTTAELKVIDLGFTDEAVKNADELMQLCKDYQKRHGKKN